MLDVKQYFSKKKLQKILLDLDYKMIPITSSLLQKPTISYTKFVNKYLFNKSLSFLLNSSFFIFFIGEHSITA